MIYIPNKKSIVLKIIEYKAKYFKEHGQPPNIIYLDAEELEDLRKALAIEVWKWPVTIDGMDLRKEEDFLISTDKFRIF